MMVFIFLIMPRSSVFLMGLLDSLLLIIIVFPLMYLYIHRPMILEIKEHKLAEDRLSLQGQIIETMEEGVFLIRASDGMIVYANPKFEIMYGYEKDELIGKHISVIYAPAEKNPQDVAEYLIRILKETGIWSAEVHNKKKDGTTFWCYANVSTFEHPEYGKVWIAAHTDITKTRMFSEELRLSEERFRSMMRSAFDAIIIVDGKGNIILWNTGAKNMFGYSEQEAFGKPFTMLLPEKFRSSCTNNLDIATGKTNIMRKILELQGLKKDGIEFPIELTLATWEVGKERFYSGIIRDITQRKMMDDKLKEVELRYRTLFERSPDGVIIIDPKTMLPLMFNDAACKQLGYTREEFSLMHISDYETKETPERTKARIEKILREGRDDFETKHRTKIGEIRDVLVTVQTIKLSGGTVLNVIFRDITERKRAEEKLRESEDRYRRLVDFATFGIAIHSDRKFVYANPAALKMLGASKPEDIIGKTVLEIVPPEYHDLVRERIAKQEKGEVAHLIEEKVVKLDGTVIDVELISIPFIYEGKLAMYGVFQDISNRKKAQEEIKKSLREKEILLREIHHRVKNNMQIISSLLNLQSGYVEEEKYRDMLKESQARILSMALIHENLYQSRDITKIELNDYIRDLVNNLFQSYATSENKIKFNKQIEKVSLGIDSAMSCGLIINELVSNSLKHAFPDAAEGEINIAFRQTDENTFELIVSDNGIGLPDNLDLQKIGSMGLFLVKMLVEDQLEGEISLDRSRGTKFSITFKGGH